MKKISKSKKGFTLVEMVLVIAIIVTFPELTNKVSSDDYEKLIDHAIDIGVEYAFIQGDETDKSSFIPAFDYSGL